MITLEDWWVTEAGVGYRCAGKGDRGQKTKSFIELDPVVEGGGHLQ